MPSQAILEQKKAAVVGLTDVLRDSVTGVLVEYKGINVADDTRLRSDLRAAGVNYRVVKNSLLVLAAKQAALDGLIPYLTGTTALATSTEDYAAAARILSKYALTSRTFKLKTGFLDGKVIDTAKLDALAKLPSREILLATVCNAFQAPIAAFARAVQAVVDKDAPAESEPTAEEAAEPAAETAVEAAAEPVAETAAEAATEPVAEAAS